MDRMKNQTLGTGITVYGNTFSDSLSILNGSDLIGVTTQRSQLDATNLNVSGFSTFNNTVDINADLDVDGFSELDGVNISETLNVVGISTFGDDVVANANVSIAGTATITLDLDVDGQTDLDVLNVSEIATFSDDVIFTGASYNMVWDKSDNALELADNAKISIGSDGDFTIIS